MAAQATTNPHNIPEGSLISDLDLVRKVMANSRRRMIVEMVMAEMDIFEARGTNFFSFKVSITGRRVCLVPEGKAREALLSDRD